MTRKLKTALPTQKESPIQYVHIKYVERGRRQNVTEPWTLQHRKPTYLQNKLQTARKITGIRHAKPSKQACFRIPAWLTFGTWTLDYWSPHVKDGIGWCLPMSISSTGSLPHLHHPSNMPPIPPKSITLLICKGLQACAFRYFVAWKNLKRTWHTKHLTDYHRWTKPRLYKCVLHTELHVICIEVLYIATSDSSSTSMFTE